MMLDQLLEEKRSAKGPNWKALDDLLGTLEQCNDPGVGEDSEHLPEPSDVSPFPGINHPSCLYT